MRGVDRRVVLGLHRTRHDRGVLEAALDLGVRQLDTSYNYLRFASHRTLADIAADLLPHFYLSTKIGFFGGSGAAAHCLDPVRLSDAARRSADDLGRVPDVVFLHNPERSLRDVDVGSGLLADACHALASITDEGLCASWGISSWDPRPVLRDWVDHAWPQPEVIMCRAGLLGSAAVLAAAEQLTELTASRRWGMSPFGGSVTHPAWRSVDPRIFLRPGQESSPLQAAFRVAYDIPQVDRVAVGTSSESHLGQLVSALSLETDADALGRYRRLLAARQATARSA
ncbi:MAG: aldo/keto reductase [Thermocrispum sp.]